MLTFTARSTFCVNLDRCSDYIPIASSITNLTDLFLKHVFRPCIGETKVENIHYFVHLETKSSMRCVMLLFPILGNLFILLIDTWNALKAQELESLAKALDKESEAANRIQLYDQAAMLGSKEGLYQVAVAHISGQGLTKKDPQLAEKLLRRAAALGHTKALGILNNQIFEIS